MLRRKRPQRNLALLERLTDGGVEFCIIGGIAAVLHGATRTTVDLDVAAPFTEENLGRLLAALADLDVRHATRPVRCKPSRWTWAFVDARFWALTI